MDVVIIDEIVLKICVVDYSYRFLREFAHVALVTCRTCSRKALCAPLLWFRWMCIALRFRRNTLHQLCHLIGAITRLISSLMVRAVARCHSSFGCSVARSADWRQRGGTTSTWLNGRFGGFGGERLKW